MAGFFLVFAIVPDRERRTSGHPWPPPLRFSSVVSVQQAVAAQQRFRLGLAAAEGDEAFQRGAAAAHREHFATEARAGGGVDHAAGFLRRILERAERVRTEQLGPEITVVAGRVAAREDVAERMREALPRRRM